MATLGKTSKLQAVNQMLSFIGEAPVNSLEDAGGVGDVSLAERTLDEVTVEVLSQGWHFNTNYDVVHKPDANKQIVLSDTVLRIDTKVGVYGNMDVSLRGNKLYNRADNSYEFDESEIKTTEVMSLPWEDLPEAARRYITLRSARLFQDRAVGAEDLREVGMREELSALATLREYDSEASDYSVFDGTLPLKTISDYRRTTAW
jgi:hypothetical protein